MRQHIFSHRFGILGGVAGLILAVSATATTARRGFEDARVVTGLVQPTAMQFAPDGRLFVCQQEGDLRIIKNGVLLEAPFLTVDTDSRGERGLLGVAFDPNFDANGFVYIHYTARTPRVHNRVSRVRAIGDVAAPGEEVILDLTDLSSSANHNGGRIGFGPDGMLYVASGDNGDGDNAQRFTNLLGKILRISPDGTIPADNPFAAQTTGQNRAIWAIGLRNPYQFDFERETGRMFILDVGQGDWEEINLGVAGSNYGWPETEGPTDDARFRGPLFAYPHGEGDERGCAITAGAFYNPANFQFPDEFRNTFLYADLCNGWIRRLSMDGTVSTLFATDLASPVDFKIGPDGTLFTLSFNSGEVRRIRFAGFSGPANLRTTTLSASRADLAWDDHNTDETGFQVERRTGTGARYTRIGVTGPNQTTFAVTGLRAGIRYSFRVRALRPAGPTEYSDELAVNTPAPGRIHVRPTSLQLRPRPGGPNPPRGEVIVRNIGRGPLVVALELVGGRFALVGAGPNFVLDPGAERRIQVEFLPGDAPTATGTLTIRSDDATRRTVTVRLRGVS